MCNTGIRMSVTSCFSHLEMFTLVRELHDCITKNNISTLTTLDLSRQFSHNQHYVYTFISFSTHYELLSIYNFFIIGQNIRAANHQNTTTQCYQQKPLLFTFVLCRKWFMILCAYYSNNESDALYKIHDCI